MDDLMKCLYEFIHEKRMGSLRQDEEYKACNLDVKLQKERVEACMSEEQRKELNWLLDAVVYRDSIENEHAFRAALALARELNALVRG